MVVTVTVKDIIEYLSVNFKLDAEVCLHRDGWDVDNLDHEDVQELIDSRGIFTEFQGYVFIDN